jgi:hypothetical protein
VLFRSEEGGETSGLNDGFQHLVNRDEVVNDENGRHEGSLTLQSGTWEVNP